MCLRTDGLISLTEAYQLSFQQRELIIKSFNEIIEEKNKAAER